MITAEDSMPKKTKNYLVGQDILWTQFNEVSFYVEDVDQENFYFQILKKIFSNIKFERIFPLGGKPNVINEANRCLKQRDKVFILDLDFDEILQKKEVGHNLFYLKRYSIENYLVEKTAINEFIKEELVKINDLQISQKFSLNDFLVDSKNVLQKLASYFLIIKKHDLNVKYLKISPVKDCSFDSNVACLKPESIKEFHQKIESDLSAKDGRLTISAQLKIAKKSFNSVDSALKNIPGKYILNLLKYRIERIFGIKQIPLDSFVYRLAKNCTLNSLNFLKDSINSYINLNA